MSECFSIFYGDCLIKVCDHALLSWATITCKFTWDDHLHYQVFLTPRWPFENPRWNERQVLWVRNNANKPWFRHEGSLFCTVPLPVLLKCPFEEHEILIPVCAWTEINVCVYCLVWFNKNTGRSNWQSHSIAASKWGQTWIFGFYSWYHSNKKQHLYHIVQTYMSFPASPTWQPDAFSESVSTVPSGFDKTQFKLQQCPTLSSISPSLREFAGSGRQQLMLLRKY